jgi:hypothetical protein
LACRRSTGDDRLMSAYPVAYECDHLPERSRLTTFFRLLLAIPHLVVLSVLGMVTYVLVVIAWFALLVTGRWPRGLYDFVAGYLRYTARVNAYTYLAVDAYPPFDTGEHPEYPARLVIAPPLEAYSRAKVLFRVVLVLPVLLIAYAMSTVSYVGAMLAWFAIVFTGRQPEALQGMINLGLGYAIRAAAYQYVLTEDWPPFGTDGQSGAVQVSSPSSR